LFGSLFVLGSQVTLDQGHSPVQLRYLPPVSPANLAAAVLLSIFSRLSRFLPPASSTHGLLTSWLFPSSALCFSRSKFVFATADLHFGRWFGVDLAKAVASSKYSLHLVSLLTSFFFPL
jgi:hypothetical protein